MNRVKLFLDLEATIIESGDCPVLMQSNIDSINNMIRDLRITNDVECFIFSFWLHNESDIILNRYILDTVFSVIDSPAPVIILKEIGVFNSFKLRFPTMSISDMNDFTMIRKGVNDLIPKSLSFEWVCRDNFTDCHCILIDDMVLNESIHVKGLDLIIETKNINSLK